MNVINIDTGGGLFTFTLEKEASVALADVPVYVFTSGGSYLGMTAHTDANGQVFFDLSNGDYKFRADYLGYRFWSNVSTVPATLSDVLTISHRDITITVQGLYTAPAAPIQGVRVYLFTESGSYLGQYADTDAQGEVVFNLPDKSYKVRADYLGYQFWSSPFISNDADVFINSGLAVLHVTKGGADVADAPVYLFTAAGSYLGKYEYTGANGLAQFMLPDQQYKFRVDYNGTQYWSDVVTIIPHEENTIELNLDLLALNLTNDPNPVRFDGKPPEVKPDRVLVASLSSVHGLLMQSMVAQVPGEAVYYFINDHLGTPQKMVDESGSVVWSADYHPFGKVNVTVNSVDNNFRFPGQYYDKETGLHYNWHRYYDPSTGRYLKSDPIGLAGGINLFLYAEGNPINAIDPYGLTIDPLQLYDPSVPFIMPRLASISVGFSYAGQDHSVKFYDETGWHFPTKIYRGMSTTLLGFGGSMTLEEPDNCESSLEKTTITIGQSKYLGISTSLDTKSYSINIGAAMGLPGISLSRPLSTQGWNELINPLILGP